MKRTQKLDKKKNQRVMFYIKNLFAVFFVVVGMFMVVTPAFAASALPQISNTNDTDKILQNYTQYLRFVTEVGQHVDRNNTHKLIKIYNVLKRRNHNSAALFLKGLRFEIVQKVELMGVDPDRISTNTPEIRRWVSKYMREWVREADEHLFRVLSTPRAELARAE